MPTLEELSEKRFLPAAAEDRAEELIAKLDRNVAGEVMKIIDKIALWVVPVPAYNGGRCRLCSSRESVALEFRTSQVKVKVLGLCQMCLENLKGDRGDQS